MGFEMFFEGGILTFSVSRDPLAYRLCGTAYVLLVTNAACGQVHHAPRRACSSAVSVTCGPRHRTDKTTTTTTTTTTTFIHLQIICLVFTRTIFHV